MCKATVGSGVRFSCRGILRPPVRLDGGYEERTREVKNGDEKI